MRRLRHTRRHSRWRLLRSTKRSIGQPPTDRAFYCFLRALLVAHAERYPLVVAEVELGKIPLQVLLADVVIDAADAPLEDREITFDHISVSVTTDIFFDRMVDRRMAREAFADAGINRALIGAEVRILGDRFH